MGLGVSGNLFSWEDRYKVALGVAEALENLHKSAEPIIHKDVKSSNILLSDDFQPQVQFNLLLLCCLLYACVLTSFMCGISCPILGLLPGHQAVRMIWIPLMLLEHLGEFLYSQCDIQPLPDLSNTLFLHVAT